VSTWTGTPRSTWRLTISTLRRGKSIVIDGHSLSVPALVATARHNIPIVLNGSPEIRAQIQKSRDVIVGKVETSQSVYGVSTGFGGSGTCFRPKFFLRLVAQLHLTSKLTLARPTPWLSAMHYCSISMRVFYLRPRMSSLPFLFSILLLLPVCQNRGFVERSSSASIL
jgi:hypothetical protein